jgi:23S rRNA (cytidine1920-2'-O)/16S rRNA (cytidine1409-2'-O)-methyltransferase
VIREVVTFASAIGLVPKELEFSPIKGPEGNIEYLVHLLKREAPEASAEEREDQVSEISGEVLSGEQEMTAAGALSEEMIRRVVKKAHQSLD